MIKVLNRKVFRELRILLAQTISISILIISGVSLLVSSWSVYRSLVSSKEEYYRNYRFAELFADVKAAPARLVQKIESTPGVRTAEGRLVLEGLLTVPDVDEPAVGKFVSVPSGVQPALNQLHIRKGRLPLMSDEIEVVVHEAFAKAHHLGLGDLLTATIQGQREPMRVVGIAISPEFVYALSASAPLPDDLHYGVFWLPLRQLERMAKMHEEMNSVVMELDHSVKPEWVKSNIDQILKPYGSREVYDRSRQMSNLFVEDEINEQKTIAVLDPLIFISIAAFLIHTILSRMVAIHRPQIATLKSLGYSDMEISIHYLKIVFLIVLGGSLLGILAGRTLGQLLLKNYVDFFHFPTLDFSLNSGSILLGFGSGIFPGLLGGWLSLRTVYRLSPVEAMRPPVPPAYQRRWIELPWLWQRLKARKKLFLRNLLLKPLRLFMTVIGISAALSIVITGNAWRDMLDFLLSTEFQRVQREDMTLGFIHPLPLGAIRELQSMKGVVLVEGYRSIPVRIRFKNREKELQLSGLVANPRIHQKIDTDLRPIVIPDQGLVLTRYFEKEWGMKPGDSVLLETIEGKLQTLILPVVGFTDDLLGLSATMNLNYFWKVFQEQPSYNMANLKIDPLREQETFIALKNRPDVYSVVLKQLMYRGFQKTFAGMMKIFMNVVIFFAFLIASGVIFNSVRIGFSERSWEMSSLRVMGFNQSSLILLLLSEVAMQMGLAILPGLYFGYGLVHLTSRAVHTETFGIPVVIYPETYLLSITVIFTAWFASSIWVLQRVRKLSLIEALKTRD